MIYNHSPCIHNRHTHWDYYPESIHDGIWMTNNRIHGHEWFEIRGEVLERDDEECQNCGERSNLVIHHIVPIENGGTNRLSNLVTLCRKCHRKSHGQKYGTEQNQTTKTSRNRYLEIEEVRNLIGTTKHPLYQATLGLLVKTGIGVGELCNLDRIDLNRDETDSLIGPFSASPDIPHLTVRYGGDIPYSNVRRRFTDTILPLDAETISYLRKWLLIRPDTDHDALFVTTAENWGKRITPESLRHLLDANAQRCIPYDRDGLNPSDLRNCFEERYDGHPNVRTYFLSGIAKKSLSWDMIRDDYNKNIFKLSAMD